MPTNRHPVSHMATDGRKPSTTTHNRQPGTYRLQPGLFIVFEGLDGAGKTTQIQLLATSLQQRGYDVTCLKEPTDGQWGHKIRQSALTGRKDIAPDQELNWFLKDRREDVEYNIQPALIGGSIVILDRYYFSTMAYQGALGYAPDDIQQRNEAFAPPPDLLFLLEIDPANGLERVQQARQLDGFEQLEYLQQVAAIFAEMEFAYLRRITASVSIDRVQAHIQRDVDAILQQWPHQATTDDPQVN